MAKKEIVEEEVKTEEVKDETSKKGKAPIAAIIIIAVILLILINGIVAFLLITKPWEKKDNTTTTTTAVVNNKVTITFNTNGGNAIESMEINKGEQITLPTPVYEGHTFKWWIDNDEIVYNTEATFENNVTLNAVWEDPNDKTKTLKVTFDSKGGSKVKDMTFTCKDNAATLKNLPKPTKDSYEFRAWEDKHGKAILDGAKITCDGDLKLYAAWEYDGPTANPEQNPNPTWKCPAGYEFNESTK